MRSIFDILQNLGKLLDRIKIKYIRKLSGTFINFNIFMQSLYILTFIIIRDLYVFFVCVELFDYARSHFYYRIGEARVRTRAHTL